MSLIISIRPARGGRKMLLRLDDGTLLRVAPELIEQLGLVPGAELTSGEIEALSPPTPPDEAEPARAEQAAARLLSHRPLSEAELMKKLLQKGFSQEAAVSALKKMRGHGFVDDAAYAALWAEEYVRRGLSARAMAAKLREKGLSRDTIEEATADLPPPDDTLDALLLQKAKGQPLDRSLRQKLFTFLYGRGFATADIQSALQRYGQNLPGDDGDFE